MTCSSLKTGVLAISVCLLAAAVSPAWSGQSDFLLAEGAKIGIALPGQNHDCLNREGKFLQQSFRRDGYLVSVYFEEGPAGGPYSQISRMLQDGCDVVIVGSESSQDLELKILEAHAHHLRILSCGTMLVNPYDSECLSRFAEAELSERSLLPGNTVDPGCIEVFSGVRAGTEFDADILEAISVISPYVEKGAVLMHDPRTEPRGLINDYDQSFIANDTLLAALII